MKTAEVISEYSLSTPESLNFTKYSGGVGGVDVSCSFLHELTERIQNARPKRNFEVNLFIEFKFCEAKKQIDKGTKLFAVNKLPCVK